MEKITKRNRWLGCLLVAGVVGGLGWLLAPALFGIGYLLWGGAVMPLLAGNVKLNWDEEVLLANGQSLIVHRETTYAHGSWKWESLGGLKKQSISFSYNGKEVKWENDDKPPVGETMPDILDIVDDAPVVVLPARGKEACNKYGFPQEGLVAFAYRNGAWGRVPISELPTNLMVNLLRDVPGKLYYTKYNRKDYKGKLLPWGDKIGMERDRYQTNPGQSIVEASKYYATGKSACWQLNPQQSMQVNKAMKRDMSIEANATEIIVQSAFFSDVPVAISHDELLAAASGKWTGGNTSFNHSCKGIVDDVSSNPVSDNTLTMYNLLLDNKSIIPITEVISVRADVVSVICNKDNIFVIRRPDDNRLIIHRFSHMGNQIDILHIKLTDIYNIFPEKQLVTFWKALVDEKAITLVFVELDRASTPGNYRGTLNKQATYKVQLP